MADSVIIFDEIQSLPMNTINLFNEIVSFLSKIQSLYSLMIVPMMVPNRCRTGSIHI